MKKQKMMGLALGLAGLMALAACGSAAVPEEMPVAEEAAQAADMASESAVWEDGGSAPAQADPGGAPLESQQREDGQKIIRTAELTLWSPSIRSTYNEVEKKALDIGGYVSDAQYSQDGNNMGVVNEYGEYIEPVYHDVQQHSVVFRIPAAYFESFLRFVRDQGEVEQENVYSEDVTTAYYDSQTRLKSRRIQLGRLEALLEKADTLKDILELEKEIAAVIEQIEQLEGTLKRYDKLVAYSTVTIRLMQTSEQVLEEPVPPSFGQRLANTASVTWQDTQTFFQGFLLFVIRALPVLLLAVIGGVVWLCLRRRARRLSGQQAPENKAASHASAPQASSGQTNDKHPKN